QVPSVQALRVQLGGRHRLQQDRDELVSLARLLHHLLVSDLRLVRQHGRGGRHRD
ncbi:unnamed protein product, partial [Tenebrio molitor]